MKILRTDEWTAYGHSFVTARQLRFSSISLIYPQISECGLAPLPACGFPLAESFDLKMEIGE